MTLIKALQNKIVIICLLFFCPILFAGQLPVIAVASSLKFVIRDIVLEFQKDTGETVLISYGSSGNLTRQIIQGGPYELFLSANRQYVEQLFKQHKTADFGVVYALGRMALIAHKNSPFKLDGELEGIKHALLEGLLLRFSIANPAHAPYGIAAREILQKIGLWKKIRPVVVMGENAAQATHYVSAGAAQAGLVSYALVVDKTLQKKIHIQIIPSGFHQPIEQSAVLLNHAGNVARQFYHYLQQPKAQLILKHYGYSQPRALIEEWQR